MRRTTRIAVLVAATLAVLAAPLRASAAPFPTTFTYTRNMHPLGFSPRANTVSPFTANSDLAFWGRLAFQGNYDGFRIVDVRSPSHPRELLDYRECAGNQGDVIVWGNVLVRSWNSPAPAGATCDGQPVAPGWEGLHVFDVSAGSSPHILQQPWCRRDERCQDACLLPAWPTDSSSPRGC